LGLFIVGILLWQYGFLVRRRCGLDAAAPHKLARVYATVALLVTAALAAFLSSIARGVASRVATRQRCARARIAARSVLQL